MQGYLGTYDTADKVYNILFDFGSSILFWLTLIALVVRSPHSHQPAHRDPPLSCHPTPPS